MAEARAGRHVALRLARGGLFLALGISLVTLAGWATGTLAIVQLRPGWPVMSPWAAVWVAGLSVGVLVQQEAAPGHGTERSRATLVAGRSVVAAVGASAVVVLLEYVLDASWIGAWWFPGTLAETRSGAAGRPALSTAVAVTALAVLVLLIRHEGRWVRTAWLGCQAVALSFPVLALAGYTFSALEVFATSLANGMALRTAIGLLLVTLATLVTRPDRPVVSWLADRPDRVTLMRLALVIGGIPAGIWLVRGAASTYLQGERDPWVVAVLLVTLGVGFGVYAVSSRQQRDLFDQLALREEVEAERALLRVSSDALLDPQILLEPERDTAGRVIDFRYADANRAACQYLGRDRDELVGSSLREGSPGLTRAGLLERYARVAETGEALELEDYSYRGAPGEPERLFAVHAVRVPDGRLSVTWRDVTSERRNARQLAESEERYRLLAENTADAVALTRDDVFQFVSPSVTTALAWRPEDLVGRSVGRLIHPDDRAGVLACRARVEGGETARLRFRFRGGDDEYRWLEAVAAPFIGPSQRRDGIVLNLRVIDETVRVERELRQARLDAEQAADAKATFLANMSHEIRTPLTAVLGLLRLLHDSEQSELQRDYTVRAERSAQSLLGILNDILDFSKIDAGALVLHEQEFSLDALFRNLGTVLAASLGDKPVDLLFDLDPETPDRVLGDELRLRQILLNLCGNAVKFTPTGHILLATRVRQRTPDTVVLDVRVEDTGIGMAPEVAAHVKDSFVQGDPGTARRYGGTGLGLAITSRLLGLMGSDLEVASTPGRGSTFSFTLTLGLSPAAVAKRPPTPPLRVHLVGGQPALKELVSRVCTMFGWSVDLLPDTAASPTPDGGPDVVLVDLPGVAVETVVRLRRDHPRPAGATPGGTVVIALATQTGIASLPDSVASKLDGYLVKPFTPSSLLDMVVSSRARPTLAIPSPIGRMPRLPGIRVLVVDDNEITREVVAEMLRREEAVVSLAGDGRQAVEAVLAEPEHLDVVLMDEQMPGMDGLAATRAIRAHPAADRLPVIALTANATEADRRACLEAGMNDHLSKPFDLDDLVSRIRHWTTTQLVAPPAPAPTTQPTTTESHTEGPAGPVLDVGAALGRVGGNEEFYDRMLSRFAAALEERVAAITTALDEGDRQGAARLAHALAGSAATLGAMALAEAARALEGVASAANDPADDSAACRSLRDRAADAAGVIDARIGGRASDTPAN